MARTVVFRSKAACLLTFLSAFFFILTAALSVQAEPARLIWSKVGSPKIHEVWNSLAGIDHRGGVVMFGSGSDTGTDALGNPLTAAAQVVARFHADGSPDWISPYTPVNSPQSVVTMDAAVFDSQDNAYVTGALYTPTPTGAPNFDIVVRKLNRRGEQLWADRYDFADPAGSLDTAAAIAPDGSGGVFVSGSTQAHASGGGMQMLTTIHYDSDGNRLWTAHHSNEEAHEQAVAVASDGAGGAYVVGKIFPAESGGAVAIRYDSTGKVLWEARPEGIESPYGPDPAAAAAVVDKLGALYLAVNGLDGVGTVTTLKYDPGGVMIWRIVDRVTGGRQTAFGMGIDWRGQVVVGSSVHSGRSGYVVTKLSAGGKPRGKVVYQARKTETLYASDMGLDDSGNVYVTGLSMPNSSGPHKHATVKFGPAGEIIWRFDFGGSRRQMVSPPRLVVSSRQIVAVSGQTNLPTVTNSGSPIMVMEPALYLIH